MIERRGRRFLHDAILTALPLLISALFGHVSAKSSSEFSNTRSISPEQKQFHQVPLLKHSSSSPEEYNPFDAQDILRDSFDRNQPLPLTSSELFDKSSKFFNTKPIPLLVTKRGDAQPGKSYNDCFFRTNCPPQDGGGDWAFLNRLQNQPDIFRHKLGTIFDTEQIALGDHKTQTLSIPFTVKATEKAGKPSGISLYPTGTRMVRTTTPSADANWVKLQPVLKLPPSTYDPFTLSKNGSSEEVNSTSVFANRMGPELNPETFAERHGWKDGKYSGPGGSKLPAWLEELNYQHGGYGGNRRQGFEPDRPGSSYDRDREENNRWVKLDAVPVAGVKISKWVPKNTAPSELPSTSWKYPDPNKSSWWDRMDNYDNSYSAHQQQQKQNNRPPPYPPTPNSAWPARYPQQRPHHQHQHHQSDAWSDVIYPNNNPVSATASWASDTKAQASQSVGVGWKKNSPSGTRYPVASWSASGSENGRPSSNGYSSSENRPYRQYARPPRPSYGEGKPPYYPDPDNKDDQQWVLISSSKNTQQHGGPSSIGNKYSVYDEFPYPYNNRHSKRISLTKPDTFNSLIPTRPMMTQDELFHRTNATLHSLRPVLGGNRGGSNAVTENPPLSQTLIDMLTSTAANIVESTTMKYNSMGMGRSSTPIQTVTSETPRKKRLLEPAAVAASSMIPTTFGSIIPMVFGRKRRDAQGHFEVSGNLRQNHIQTNPNSIEKS